MASITCSHKHCDEPLFEAYARYRYSDEHGAVVPFHTGCSYAGPDYDVSKGLGAPFTTIAVRAV